jgi:hypothetical protein
MTTDDIDRALSAPFALDAGGLYAVQALSMDSATTADDVLTVLYGIAPDYRATALGGRGLRMLRAVADLVGVDSVDMGARSCITARLENF